MRKLVALTFGVCLMIGAVKAQTIESKYGVDSVKTIENASIYSEFVKQKNYKDALPAWKYIFKNAPKFQMMTYTRGEDIMLGMLQKTKSPAYVDSLMMVYDQWIKYFGDHDKLGEGYVLGKKGFNLYRFGKKDEATIKQAYNYLMKSYDMEKDKTHPLTVKVTIVAADELLKKSALSKEDFIGLYMQFSDYAESGIKQNKGTAKEEAYADVKSTLDAVFMNAGVADCATLNTLLTPRFNDAKNDPTKLREIMGLLRRSECSDLPLYAQVAEIIYKNDPTSEAAYSLAIMFLKRQEFDKAEAYLKEAIDKATDETAKADYYFRMAQLKLSKGQLAEAKRNAMNVLAVNPNSGQALILLGKAYASYSKNYGEDEFDHRSVFWVAVDKFARAKQVDPSVAEEANTLINQYSQHFPTKEEGFFRAVTPGVSVKIGDWIGETTTARFTK